MIDVCVNPKLLEVRALKFSKAFPRGLAPGLSGFETGLFSQLPEVARNEHCTHW